MAKAIPKAQLDQLLPTTTQPEAPIFGVFKTVPEAVIPTKGTVGAACYDLSAAEAVSIAPGLSAVVSTGLRFQIPEGYVLQVYSRSGHGFKHGVRLANSVGVVDQDFLGEVKVCLYNDSRQPFHVKAGDRIAQCRLETLVDLPLTEIKAFTKSTERGEGGFGSTGA